MKKVLVSLIAWIIAIISIAALAYAAMPKPPIIVPDVQVENDANMGWVSKNYLQ